MSLNYVIWNITPQIADFGKFEIRYYSLLFALGFIMGYWILLKIFTKQGLKVELLDTLTIYMVLSTIIGARLGHCLFYEFDYYIKHPLEIILPWRGSIGNDFEFTGFQGLASHGAAVGILIGIYLFSRKTKSSYLWTMDMIVLVTALAGASIRVGNLMNSEIYGSPTQTSHGFVFVNDFTKVLKIKYADEIDEIRFDRIENKTLANQTGVPIELTLKFHRKIKDESIVRKFGENILPEDLIRYNYDHNVFPVEGNSMKYRIEKDDNHLILITEIGGLPRYPTQIYEAASYFLIFLILLGIFYYYGPRLKNGYIFGVFLFLLFLARFFIEYIKENQEAFEDSMALNMGQILSIPFIAAGIALLIWKWPKKKETV